ncbi:MAG: ATP-grasp domain-containing protein, partial [Bacteroidota bacterium]|nr:ATP-grasp domain-containing protein [Bacteroidota bacterium]
MKKVLILESKSDQAKTFASYLQKSDKFDLHTIKDIISEKKNFDEIIPTSADSTYNYVKKNGDFSIGNLTYSKNNLVTFDKIKTLSIVDSIGVPIPKSFTSKESLDFFPIFYKSLREEGKSIRGIIQNSEELSEITEKDVFYQEFIWSKGTYSVGFLADRGKLITIFIQKELLSYPYHGGSGVILEHIQDKRLLEYTKKIVKEINYSGWGLTEFKYSNKIKDFVFMEVNAKFWASIKFAIFNNPLILKLLFNIDKQ